MAQEAKSLTLLLKCVYV